MKSISPHPRAAIALLALATGVAAPVHAEMFAEELAKLTQNQVSNLWQLHAQIQLMFPK